MGGAIASRSACPVLTATTQLVWQASHLHSTADPCGSSRLKSVLDGSSRQYGQAKVAMTSGSTSSTAKRALSVRITIRSSPGLVRGCRGFGARTTHMGGSQDRATARELPDDRRRLARAPRDLRAA